MKPRDVEVSRLRAEIRLYREALETIAGFDDWDKYGVDDDNGNVFTTQQVLDECVTIAKEAIGLKT